jgi:hypothetical protein
MPLLSQTYTATVEDISAVSTGVWRITIANAQAIITNNPLQTIAYDYIADTNVKLSPYINVPNVAYHPYNATLNNASLIANSANVQKIDYSDNPTVPLNLDAIRNNVAEKADVQELIYNSAGFVRGRYGGEQLIGAEVNKYTEGDISYGKVPVVEQTTPYFCIFDYISGFSPEHNQANAILIAYIVDEEGNLTTPDSSVALNLLKQSFPSSTEFDVSIQGSSTGGPEAALLGTHTVLRSGTRIEPIVFSYTAATYLNPVYNAASKLEFEADPTLQTYEARATGSNQSITNTTIGARTQITFGKELNDDAGNYNPGTSKYIFGSDTEQQVKFTGNFTIEGDGWPDPYGGDPGLATIKIEHTTDGGTFDPAYTTVIGSKTFSYINYIPITVNVSSPYQDFASGEAVRVMVEIEDRTADLTFNQSILNAISAESGSTYVDWGSEGYFFTTGSSQTPTVLTASIALSDKYEKYFAGISASGAQGFNEVTLPFTLQRGDEFKFDNSEKKSYMITAVETPSENTVGRLYVTLDKQMSKAANKDFFAIRRYVDASNMILMSVLKVGGTQNTGILYPKYPSPRLKANYEKIISDLKTKGIL